MEDEERQSGLEKRKGGREGRAHLAHERAHAAPPPYDVPRLPADPQECAQVVDDDERAELVAVGVHRRSRWWRCGRRGGVGSSEGGAQGREEVGEAEGGRGRVEEGEVPC